MNTVFKWLLVALAVSVVNCQEPEIDDEPPVDVASLCSVFADDSRCKEANDNTPVSSTPGVTKPLNSLAGDPLKCGKRRVGGVLTRLTEKIEADFGEFPWMVAVLATKENKKATVLGGGALISPRVVLTAAHIISRGELEPVKIRAGEWDVSSKGESLPYQARNVSRIIMHPKFFYERRIRHDLALLVLSSPVNMTAPNVGTICLPKTGQQFQGLCTVSGWGRTTTNGSMARILKRVPLPMVSNAKCEEALRRVISPRYMLHESFVCAGGGREDACKGDGGSPLVCSSSGDEEDEDSPYILVGAVSWGIECGRTGVPGMYTNIALHRDWIVEQLTDLGEDIPFLPDDNGQSS